MDLFRRLISRPQTNAPSEQPVTEHSIEGAATESQFEWPSALNPFPSRPDILLYPFLIDSPELMIIIPGYGSSPVKPKYEDIISLAVHEFGASVIAINNDPGDGSNYGQRALETMRLVINYAARLNINGGGASLKIKLLGSSAGGSAVAAIAGEFSELIDEIYLLGPSFDVPRNMTGPRAVRFTGRVNLLRGSGDEICTPEVASEMLALFPNIKTSFIRELEGADHAFSNEGAQEGLLQFLRLTKQEA